MDAKYIAFLAVAVTYKVQFSVLDHTEGGSDMLWWEPVKHSLFCCECVVPC
jgi:hypothetical protein